MLRRALARIGDAGLDGLAGLGRTFLLFLSACGEQMRPPYRLGPLVRETCEIGAKSLWVITALGFCFGMALVQQTGITLKRFGADQYVGRLVALGMFRELGPILTGFMVAARAGAGIAAEIGAMRVTEQIDALRACGGNPVRLLVAPRIFATAITLPLLTAVANLLGILGGLAVAVTVLGIEAGNYLYSIPESVAPADFLVGLFKTFFFGIIVGAVGCHEGLNASGGSLGVSRAARQSVVKSVLLILVADLMLTGMIFAVGGILSV